MADVVFADLNLYKNSPIRRLVLADANTPADTITFISATAESQYELQPITRRNGKGLDHVVAWRFEAQFVPIQNNVGSMLAALDTWNRRTVDASLFLKADASQAHARKVSITLKAPVSLTWAVVKTAYGPELRVNVQKILTSLKQYGSSTTLWADDTETILEPNP